MQRLFGRISEKIDPLKLLLDMLNLTSEPPDDDPLRLLRPPLLVALLVSTSRAYRIIRPKDKKKGGRWQDRGKGSLGKTDLLGRSGMSIAVKCNSQYNDDAGYNLLNPVRQTELCAAVTYHGHDQCSDK